MCPGQIRQVPPRGKNFCCLCSWSKCARLILSPDPRLSSASYFCYGAVLPFHSDPAGSAKKFEPVEHCLYGSIARWSRAGQLVAWKLMQHPGEMIAPRRLDQRDHLGHSTG